MRILHEQQVTITPAMMANRVQRKWVRRPRFKGPHVQAINVHLGIGAGKVERNDKENVGFDQFTETNYPLLPAQGVAIEEFLAGFYQLNELIWQPKSYVKDGIAGNPDGIRLITGPVRHEPIRHELVRQREIGQWLIDRRVWECKSTTKKLQSIKTCWLYLKQGMSYCYLTGLDTVEYDVWWVLGDYSRPYQPVWTKSIVWFDKSEIRQWWDRLRENKEDVVPE